MTVRDSKMLPVKNVSDQLRPMIEEALRDQMWEHAQVFWDVSLAMSIRQDGPQAVALLAVWVPAPLLGRWFSYTTHLVDPHVATQDRIDKEIAQALQELRKLKIQALAAGN